MLPVQVLKATVAGPGARAAPFRQRSLAYTHTGGLDLAIADLEKYCHPKPVRWPWL